MNELQKAYALNSKSKRMAVRVYKDALTELADSYGIWKSADAHTELSALFGVRWILLNGLNFFDAESYAVANNAFNYANSELGITGRFYETAKEVLGEQRCEDAKWIGKATNEMNSVLTFV